MGEGQREEIESEAGSRLWARCQHRAWCRARTHELWDHDLSQSRTLNRLSHPGTPTRMFIFERERDRVWAGEGQRERETQNLKQSPGSELSAQSPTRGWTHPPWDQDLREVGRSTDWATQAPQESLVLIRYSLAYGSSFKRMNRTFEAKECLWYVGAASLCLKARYESDFYKVFRFEGTALSLKLKDWL